MARENHRNSDQTTMVTLLTIKFNLPGCSSLKEKRGRLQPILNQLKREFNLSVSEVGLQDVWQSAWIACALVSNDNTHNTQIMDEALKYIEAHFPDEVIEEQHLESR
jgi:hypothetical protein